jgi:type II secretory pathway pseudopilin PulG
MKWFQPQAGYTIIEVMFFLVISAGLFGAAVVNFSIQNRRTQFTQTVHAFDLRVQDTINDIDTGFYGSNSDFGCTAPAGGGKPVLNGSHVQQGQNSDCTFIGKAMQFGPDGNKAKFNIYTIVGRRAIDDTGTERQVQSLEEASPAALDGNPNGTVDFGTLDSGVEVTKVFYKIGNNFTSQGGGFAIISGFGKRNLAAGKTGLQSGILRISLASIDGSNFGQNNAAFSTNIEGIKTANTQIDGVLLCLQESGGGRYASVLVGGQNQKTATTVAIDDNVQAECRP